MEQYVEKQVPVYVLKEILGTSHRTLRKHLQHLGIPLRDISAALFAIGKRKRSELPSREWFVEQYEENELSARAIGELLGKKRGAIKRALRGHGIPLRGPGGPRGAKHYNWQGGKRKPTRAPGFTKVLRCQIRNRDGNRCTQCGARSKGFRQLAVHHVNFDGDDHRPENLITLCASCHARTHAGTLED